MRLLCLTKQLNSVRAECFNRRSVTTRAAGSALGETGYVCAVPACLPACLLACRLATRQARSEQRARAAGARSCSSAALLRDNGNVFPRLSAMVRRYYVQGQGHVHVYFSTLHLLRLLGGCFRWGGKSVREARFPSSLSSLLFLLLSVRNRVLPFVYICLRSRRPGWVSHGAS